MRRKSRRSDVKNAESESEETPENGSTDAETPKSRRKSKQPTKEDENGAETEEQHDDETKEDANKRRKVEKKSPKKTPKKSNPKEAGAENDDGEDDEQYEVESVIDSRKVRGVKQYLIRWKGFDASADTWEGKESLNCPDLIQEYEETVKNKPSQKKRRGRPGKHNKSVEGEEEEEAEAEYEVDKILEVHHRKDGKREFLVSWKGYPPSQDSWVNEADMACGELVERFMAKVEKAKDASPKQLREHRTQTDRFTLTTRETGRRLSRRNKGKQRVQYHNAE